MDSENEFDLKEAISTSMSSTREISPETYDYFVALSEERLVRRLTPSQAREMARELLDKLKPVS